MSKEMRKVRTGSVVRTGQDRTAVVEMVWKQRHRLYRKQVRRVARFHVHDPLNQCQLGDVVRIQEVRPISKTKRWRLLEIMERRQVADVQPIELEADAEIVVDTEEPAELSVDEEANESADLEDTEVEDAPVDEAEIIVDTEEPAKLSVDEEANGSADLEDTEVEDAPVDEAEAEHDEPSTDQDEDQDAPLLEDENTPLPEDEETPSPEDEDSKA